MPRTTAKPGALDTQTTYSVGRGRVDVSTLWVVVSAASGLRAEQLPRKKRIVVGRSRSCDIVVDDGSVSREHAAIFDAGGELRLEDLGSRNRTTVTGRALREGESAAISVGSVIEIGHATLLVQHGEPAGTPVAAGATPGTVVSDPTMQRLHALLDVIAPSPLNVLLLGETGTGKEVFAEALHARSLRARAPLVRVNCAGLAGSLLESELFGHEKGAFTGAQGAKPGLFEAATGGTLFLDEVGEMPLDTQAKVLRVIEAGEVTRLGSVAPRRVDVRYVAATHRHLEARIEDGSFRADLFFRLNGYTMTLPPLRERREDILPLAELFVERMAKAGHAGAGCRRVLGPDAQAALEQYAWPGNIRELKNVIERASVLAGPSGRIEPRHLQLAPRASDGAEGNASPLRAQRSSFEYQHILGVLEETGGDRKAAAAILGIAYRTLLAKLAENGHPSSRSRKG